MSLRTSPRAIVATLLAAGLALLVVGRPTPAAAVMPNEPPCPSCAVRLRPGLAEVRIRVEATPPIGFSAPTVRCALADGTTATLALGVAGAFYRSGVTYTLAARAPASPIVRAELSLRSADGTLTYRLPVTNVPLNLAPPPRTLTPPRRLPRPRA